MRPELLAELLADGPVGPSALDLDLDLEHPQRPLDTAPRPAAGERSLSAFDVADEDVEARVFARRRMVGIAAVSAGSVGVLLAALTLGF